MTDFYEVFHVTLGFQNLTFPYMPSLMCPSFSTAILTAYTWLARSSLVRIGFGRKFRFLGNPDYLAGDNS